MSVSFYNTKGYENLCVWTLGKSKAKQSQFRASQPVKSGPKEGPFQAEKGDLLNML
jgi:hypothetical protein